MGRILTDTSTQKYYQNPWKLILVHVTWIGLIPFLFAGACIGPEPSELSKNDELYVITEIDVLPISLDSLGVEVDVRSFRKVYSRANGYYFFYSLRYFDHYKTVEIESRGTLLKTENKATKVFQSEALGTRNRPELADEYNVDAVGMISEPLHLKLILRDGCKTYSIEIRGIIVPEVDVISAAFSKYEHFHEGNLHGYPVKWP